MSQSQFASALSEHPAWQQAVDEACTAIREQLAIPGPLADAPVDLVLVFVSPDHAAGFDALAAEISTRLAPRHLIGCSGESIVGRGREVEGQPAISIWAARLPATTVDSFPLRLQQTPDGGTFLGWSDTLPEVWPAGAGLLVLADPYTFPADYLLERLNEDQPGIPVVGGMISGAAQPGEGCLWLGNAPRREGAVAVMLHGGVSLRTVVSQGCRPIGSHYVVTRCDRNVILELGGKPAMRQLEELFQTLPTREQQAVQRGLHVGRVVSEYQDRFEQGDFLVRNVIGVSREHGAIAIGDYVRVGQTVQFHIRDADTADAELQQLLAANRTAGSAARGALLFSCNGRGTRLFPEPNHDAGAIERAYPDLPLAGFFAAGEFGPIAGRNFLHGFTASIALLG